MQRAQPQGTRLLCLLSPVCESVRVGYGRGRHADSEVWPVPGHEGEKDLCLNRVFYCFRFNIYLVPIFMLIYLFMDDTPLKVSPLDLHFPLCKVR